MKVHVRTIENPQPFGVLTSTPVTVIEPSQLSVAVRSIIGGTSPEHSSVISAGGAGATGGMTSWTVMFCETELTLPHASVKVHVRTIENPQPLGVLTSTQLTVILPSQLSVAETSIIVVTPPENSTLFSAGVAFPSGGMTSWTVMFCETELTLP